jgi:hypothetical protein
LQPLERITIMSTYYYGMYLAIKNQIISQLLTNIEDMIDPNLLQPYAKLDSPLVKGQHRFSL